MFVRGKKGPTYLSFITREGRGKSGSPRLTIAQKERARGRGEKTLDRLMKLKEKKGAGVSYNPKKKRVRPYRPG